MTIAIAARLAGALLFLGASAHAADLALAVDLDPSTRRLVASAELVAPGPYAFVLHTSLGVDAVTVDGRRTNAARGANGEWRIAAAKGAKLRIDYSGTLPALEALDHREVLKSATPMASPRGSFLSGGSGWYPQPARAFSYTVRLTLPPDQRGLVAGTLTRESTAERYVGHFSFPHAAEGIDLMAGPYAIREKEVPRAGASPIRLRTYFYSDLDSLADGYLEDSARYIALYTDAIGAYPFDAFSVVASPLPTGFGMPTLTYLGAQVLKLPFIRATSLGHEVLHNWWGNGVRVDYAGGNWSEGLTTFMADYFFRERESDTAARDMRLGWLRDFAALPEGAHVALADFRSRTHGAEAAAGYGKSAMLFIMLRDEIGDDAFRRALRTFYAEYRFKAASWSDLRAAFERASGRGLGPFFDQWLRRRGGPELAIHDARVREASGKNVLTMTLTQGSPPYSMYVPIEIGGGVASEIRRVRIDGVRQDVRIETAFVPERVRLDPALRVWRKLEAAEVSPILRQWIVAKRPRVAVVSSVADAAAKQVIDALFENDAQRVPLASLRGSREPALIAGLHADVDAALAELGGPARPPELAGRGTAQVWTTAGDAKAPALAVVSANDPEALRAMVRALPHLGAQSWLVFEGARVVERGVWPAPGRFIEVRRER